MEQKMPKERQEKIAPKAKYCLLFVDVKESLGESFVEYFTRRNFKSVYATDKDNAMKYLENNHVDVVISNMNIPGMDCLEMTEIIRKKYSAKVILFSGYPSPKNRKKAFQMGAHAYLSKPVPMEHLYGLIKKLIKKDVVYIGS